MATILPFVRLDANKIPEEGPSLAPFPAPLVVTLEGAPEPSVIGGFGGIAGATGDVAHRFGSLVKYGFSIFGDSLTAAPGTNQATMNIPVGRLEQFTEIGQAYGSLSALSDLGELLVGNIRALPGGSSLLLTLDNDTGATQSLANFELQGMVTYHLTG